MIKMEDNKKLKHWNQIFFATETDLDCHKRLKVIDVTLSELSSLKPNAKVYEGSPNSVLFATNLSSTKSQLKKEKLTIEKRMNATKVC